ncbi:hydrophobic/amphiphilic exporter-1, HAE1 family [Pseudooceanicola nitratireducens]|jgi:HAE1 family hydrophobic/amphiphilic exporter-1|uniref:Hydrophobic/amphiphilic exporter-1, HAE1 family n=1 Tax=Pseudooceanicola nitratireducens TaxID=517719 RepID=A0A1I1K2Z4_9RHOB|nr:efflux RND transporter permease subunit [Pseudooceanicola nitratireducens]SEJ49354.1 hydrophobic/amphiphilic exporter-1, HAE1 family [Pseudooceanicola nitratireducens]SFC55096.1 hydrophobic/amphiphilic exporter-1, HAE1 family [Pseudooceanicola nitratireducens]
MFLTRISVAQPVFATMIMVAIFVIGLFSYQRLPVEQLPEVDFPVVAVVTSYPGATPEAVEADIIKPIEDGVSTLSGIDTISSTAQTGSSMVLIQFELEVDSSIAAQDVRDRIAQIQGNLPDAAEDPQILRFDPSELPIISVGLSSDRYDAGVLTALAEDQLATRLSNIPGVGRASVVGGLPREVHVLLDPERQSALGIGASEVAAALAAENTDLPAGSVTEGASKQSVQVEGRIENLADFEEIIIARRGGYPVRLGDVANVGTDLAERTSLAMLDGSQALAIDIVKTQGANTVAVAEAVREEIAKLAEDPLYDGIEVSIIRDNAVPVEQSFESVQSMLVEGALLATVIVFLFLNSWRSTVITGLTLPISIIGTMAAIYFLGFTLNMMTMMALSLAVGILIDDAIVVRENIMRHLHMGKDHHQAALDGTNEIGLAVFATTLSIVAVFLPVAFMEGILGRFFLQFGVTVSVAVLISLFVSFTLDPMMSSVWYDPAADKNAKRGPLGRAIHQFEIFFDWLGRRYRGLLKLALRWRKMTLMVAVLAFVGGLALFPVVGAEFVPPADNSEVQVDLELPVGTPLDRTAEKIAQVDAVLRTFPEVIGTYGTVNSGTNSGENAASIIVRMTGPLEREETPTTLTPALREALAAIPGVKFRVGAAGGLGGGVATPIEIKIFGEDLDVLTRLSRQLADDLAARPGFADVRTSLDDPQPTIGIRIDRDAASDLGVSLAQVGQALSPMIAGQTVSDWTAPNGDSYDVLLRLPEEVRNDASRLGSLPVATNADGTGVVRLDQIAVVEESRGPGEITREGRERSVQVTSGLDGLDIRTAQPQIQEALAALELPPGYRTGFGGDSEQIAESGASAAAALLLAVVFIYLVLASQFGSFVQPLAIMSSLPLAIIGVMLGLMVGGSTLNMFSIIGFIMLMGLVVKNAILLVDNANQHRAAGMNLFDALVEAGTTRFRPIVMTTLAMIFGMLPLALNIHGGSGQNAPMAHAVIGGLISSSLLTLVVVPVLLTYIDAFLRAIRPLLPRAPDDSHA